METEERPMSKGEKSKRTQKRVERSFDLSNAISPSPLKNKKIEERELREREREGKESSLSLFMYIDKQK